MEGRRKKAALALLSMQRHSWEQGMAMQAFLECGHMDVVTALAKEAVYRSMEDGRPATIGVMDGVTDPCAVGEALCAACQTTQDAELIAGRDKLLEWARHKAPRNKDGICYHLTTGHEFWVDSTYMLPPFLAAAGYPEEALHTFYAYFHALYDEKVRLMRHKWEDDKKIFTHDVHWGVGNGWTLTAMIRLIRLLPAEDYEKDILRLQNMTKTLLKSALPYRTSNGLFYDVLDDPCTFVETNFAQMCAYTMYEGLRMGWLPAEYEQEADALCDAVNAQVDEYGFVRGVCGAPTFDKPGISPEGQAFYLMMEQAREKYKKEGK
ncbi:MAG: glycoside hydrolase family 88 protein [Lachnospiraceae bacterium]|nr:glycoside hydrolase family 88 protein [Lachnospiraceae bacterium]